MRLWTSSFSSILALDLFVQGCLGAIVEHVSELPGLEYDFIIIGGGTAGNVVANRLSEDPGHSVLVLEAGPSNDGVLDSMVPFFCTRLTPNSPYDWNFTTTPQTGLNGRIIPYIRGHMLGGSSSVNFLGYTRGTVDDWDRYARVTDDCGWSWNDIQPFLRMNEKFTCPADHHDITGEFNASVHGFNGINSVSLPGFPQPTDQRVIETTKQLPGEFPFNIDTNSGLPLGVGWTQSTIGKGTRSSSATSYLGPGFVKRRNLNVLLHAQVSRVLQTDTTSNGCPVIQAVEFTEGVGGPVRIATARKELVLSAGSIGTPHILMNSGIGNSTDLARFGIKSLVDLPSVGQNLSDHPFLVNRWTVNSQATFETLNRNATLTAQALQQWEDTREGPLVDSILNQAGWVRVADNSSVFANVSDPSAGPNTPHIELIFANGLSHFPIPDTGNFFVISTAVVTPSSRGSITLNSSNPFSSPIINPNFLSEDIDLAIMREAIRSARRFLSAPIWSGYIIAPGNNATTDTELDEFIRGNVSSFFHPVGTAAMSPQGAGFGVMDPDLRLKGAIGIRVVDASVLPFIPSAHTQAAVYVVAERAAHLIGMVW